jgi:hypothetical protein
MFPINLFAKNVFHNENARQGSNMQFEDVLQDILFKRIVWMAAIQICFTLNDTLRIYSLGILGTRYSYEHRGF